MQNQPTRSARRGRRPSFNKRRPQQQQHRVEEKRREPSPNAIEITELEGVFTSLHAKLQRALADMGFRTPTPIQEAAIPALLEGRDMIGCAQTGTGKTAAFGLPILQHLEEADTKPRPNRPHALVMAPTRELAAQIGESLADCARFTGLRHAVVFGGVGYGPQIGALTRGIDILVATPGRMLDLMEQRALQLDDIKVLVLDEADRMLDMGFLPDIRRILAKVPANRQSMLFSATMPDPIRKLSGDILTKPVEVSITPEQPAVEAIEQQLRYVSKDGKRPALVSWLEETAAERVIVFTRMKHMANRVAETLERNGVKAAAIHGNKSQSARTNALNQFRKGSVRVLVATDIAARGIDVKEITHVVNYDLPEEPETYVHRIGRTARAGANGHAVSFCGADEHTYRARIEELLRKRLPVCTDHAHHCENTATKPEPPRSPRGGGGGGRGGRSGGGGGGRGRRPQRRGQR